MTDRSDAPGTTWVARLVRDDGEEAPAHVGPFATEDEVARWAEAAADGLRGWSWWAEPAVAPSTLAAHWAPRTPHLRLVS